ncbi:MAG TPA: response regulator, partial [Acidimicrobiales bacterium]|nr:response regulator [Acidimicrobiales bacterium]
SAPAPSGADGPPLVVVHIIPGGPVAPASAGWESEGEELRENVRCEDELLARLAHDLSNPVGAISGALHLARKATSPEDIAWALDTIEGQIAHLVRQIAGLRELARIARGEAGSERPRPDADEADRAADPPGPGPDGTPPPSTPAGARVLVVDDNVDAARGTARLLELAGHDVRVAHDGRQALEVARDHHPRFILLDIVLPGMDGYEVARQLRADPQLRDAVIIATSGYSADDYRPAEEAGFDHHLAKPIDYDALRAILGRPPGAA